MAFKEWLLNEDFGGASWDLLYPTTGGDYADVNNNPLEHFWLQWKWDRGTDPDIGRILHNIDEDEFQRRGYTSIESVDMPDTEEGFWVHKPDDGSRSSVKPYKMLDLKFVAMGKDSKKTKFVELDDVGKVRIWAGPGPTSIMQDTDLDKTFHDEDRHTHKWPDIDEKYMDDDWALPQHKAEIMRESVGSFKTWLEFGGGATSAIHGGLSGLPYKTTNDNMPVRSKYTAQDSPPDKPIKRVKNGKVQTVDDEWGFKKRSIIGNDPSKERPSMWIDRKRRHLPTRNDAPDIVY